MFFELIKVHLLVSELYSSEPILRNAAALKLRMFGQVSINPVAIGNLERPEAATK